MMTPIIIKGDWKRRLTIAGACLLWSVFSFLPSVCQAQIGTWRAYMAYYEPQQIVKAGNLLFVRASNDLYAYNLNDQSITTYDKVNALNDTYITNIAWNPQTKRLIVVYQNSNIDLLDSNGNATNISGLFAKSMTQDKTVKGIVINDVFAYLYTGFGVVKVNTQRAEIAESYILNHNVTNLGIDGDNIYIKTYDTFNVAASVDNSTLAEGTVVSEKVEYGKNDKPTTKTVVIAGNYVGSTKKNLIDPHNWQYTETVPANIYNTDLTDWNNYLETVKTLQPGGPKYNHFGFLNYKNGMLYTCSGANSDRPASVQILDNEEWNILPDDVKGNFEGTGGNWTFINMFAVEADPLDNKHIFAAGRTGLYEYYDGELKNYFNKDNSILKSASTSNKYVLVEGLAYDAEGNLWMLQSQVAENSIIEITKDGEWVKHPQEELMHDGKSLNALTKLIIDSRGLLWFVNDHWENTGVFCYDPKTDRIANSFRQFNNQDGTTYNDYRPHCIVEDLEGNLWLGTKYGPFMLEKDNVLTQDTYLTQVKVPRNDGTNYADYLLSGANISCIAIDGGNRKWFGTYGAGVYLISADNMTQLQHFTTDNSPLLSDNIEAITIDPHTGEVFFGTENGLCSYMGDATRAQVSMVKDNVYAYPNPVVKDYDGLITVVGLSFNADVKIITTNGQLVAEGRSNGGTFTWNGRDRQGRRVASGVYMVVTATSSGDKGTVCKIAVIN